MAPSDEAASHGQASDSTTNPFISFRRFADEQMSNLFSGILNISSTFGRPSSSPDQAFAEYQRWLEEARRSLRSLDREAAGEDHAMHTFTAANRDAAQEEFTEAIQEFEKPSRCPYRPGDQPVSQPENDLGELSLAALRLNLRHTILDAPLLGIQRPSVPVAYLLYSPYSPIQLEQQIFLNNAVRWREAFEDLLAVQNGKKVGSIRAQNHAVPSVDWVKGMIGLAMCKRDQDRDEEDSEFNSHIFGSLPGRTVRFRTTRESEDDEADEYQAEEDCPQCAHAEELDTEMDLYSLFLGTQGMSLKDEWPCDEASSDPQPGSHPKPFSYAQHDFNSTEKTEGKKPSILSTLTTTERSTLPDGTTHTKVVLKKRFSDGREESTETMSTQNPPPKPQYQPPTLASSEQGFQGNASEASNTDKKSSGWFWS